MGALFSLFFERKEIKSPQKMAEPTVRERSFIMIKPDGVQRGLVGEIIKRFEQRGYKLVAMKLCAPGQKHMEVHYEDLKARSFFPGLVQYMISGPVCAMVWEGTEVVRMGRMILGATNPQDSLPGTIRGISVLRPEETSATALMLLRAPTRRLLTGSHLQNSCPTATARKAGFTKSRFCALVRISICLQSCI